jgi:hypothetical protein
MSHSRPVPDLVRAAFTLLALGLAAVVLAPPAFAQPTPNPPERMAYQGYVVDANGIPLATNAPRNYDVIFRIWNDSGSTAATNRLWTEQQTVTIDKGYFSVILGEGSSIGETRPNLSTVFTNANASERWIALTVKGIASGGADANILPRLRLITSPYAFLANKALIVDGAGVTTGTIGDARLSSNVALRNGGNTFSGTQIISNNVGLGTATPNFPLSFSDAAGEKISLWGQTPGNSYGFGIQSGLLQVHAAPGADIAFGTGHSTNMTEAMRIKGGGNVGIGTPTPGRTLTVNGTGNTGIQLVNNTPSTGRPFAITAGDNGSLSIKDDVNGTLSVTLDKANSTISLNGGNVGIGTASPQARLQVAGGNVQLDPNAQILFADNGEIRSLDQNHRILFRRSENKMELREIGDIVLSSGAVNGAETAAAVVKASGNVGIGTTTPAAKLQVAGAGNFLGSTPYIKFADEKPKGTQGGSAGAGLNTRAFTAVYDVRVGGSISGLYFMVLPAGTYQCRISVPAYRVGINQARLRIANADVLIYGTSEITGENTIVTTRSLISGTFTLASASSLVVEHWCASGNGANGLGVGANAWTDGNPVEVYTVAEFWKLQ